MPRLTKSVPKYRRHKSSNRGMVTIAGREIYLTGPYGSKASKAEYARLIGEWEASRRTATPRNGEPLTINRLLAAYHAFCQEHYKPKAHARTNHADTIAYAMKPLRQSYGNTLVADFGPLALKAMQQKFVVAGLSRTTVNDRVDCIRRMFRWAVSEQLAPPEMAHALAAVSNLRKGKTDAKESAPIGPVDDETVEATLPNLPAVVADMVRLQRATGMRPGELVLIRPVDVDRTGDVWRYIPHAHKNEHCDKSRVVFIGPKAQDILRPYLLRSETDYCFDPRDSEKKRRASIHEKRTTPIRWCWAD